MRSTRWGGVALAVLVAATVACGFGSHGGNSGSGNGGSGGGGGGQESLAASAPAPAKKSPDAPVSTGTVTFTFRGTNGSDRVDCSAIDTEFAVQAYSGPIAWTVETRDQEAQPAWPLVGNPVRGVAFEPSSGTLADGERVVVHVSGTASGVDRFAVVVSAPNSAGHGWVTVPFTCG